MVDGYPTDLGPRAATRAIKPARSLADCRRCRHATVPLRAVLRGLPGDPLERIRIASSTQKVGPVRCTLGLWRKADGTAREYASVYTFQRRPRLVQCPHFDDLALGDDDDPHVQSS